MEDDLNFFENGRHLNFLDNGRLPQLFRKWKTTSIFLKMEDDLNFFENGRRPQNIKSGISQQMDDNLNFLKI